MNMTIRELRAQTRQAIEIVERGNEVIITKRGKACAKIVPMVSKKKDRPLPAFGMWKYRKDIKDASVYVHNMRRSRYAR